jgi:hypothetical protein
VNVPGVLLTELNDGDELVGCEEEGIEGFRGAGSACYRMYVGEVETACDQ